MPPTSTPTEPQAAIIRPADQPVADRGGGNRTIPLVMPGVGARQLINGITLIVLDGAAIAVVGGAEHPVGPGDTTWIPPGLPHYFRNASATGTLRIFWTYASVTATRTLTATGETRPVAAEHATDRLLKP